MVDEASERACIESFKRNDYMACIGQVLSLLAQTKSSTHTLMQIVLISSQRVGYVAGIEQFGPLALDIASGDAWHRLLLEFSLGIRALPDVLNAADSDRRRCQAHYYSGARFATEGRASYAREQFSLAAALNAPCVEHELAEHELAARGRPKAI
jgi:hypothetical protein